MSDILTFNPARLTPHIFDAEVEPQWAELAEYFKAAAQAGEVVRLTTQTASMTPNEVAFKLSMSRSTVMRLINDGTIHAYRVGSHWRIPLNEYERYRDARQASMISELSSELEADLYG